MPIQVECKQCATSFSLKDHFAGKMIACPKCKENLVVPLPPKAKPKKPAEVKPLPAWLVPSKPSTYPLNQKLLTLALLLAGFALQVGGRFTYDYGFHAAIQPQSQRVGYQILITGLLLGVIGIGVFVWGCTTYARAKGYPWTLGLLGLLSVCGLPLLWLVVLIGGNRAEPAAPKTDPPVY